jgi:hypothetical protein
VVKFQHGRCDQNFKVALVGHTAWTVGCLKRRDWDMKQRSDSAKGEKMLSGKQDSAGDCRCVHSETAWE